MVDQLKTIGIEKGKPFQPTTKREDSHRRRARSARLARPQIRRRLLAAIQRRHPLGAARGRRCARRLADEFGPARRLPGGRPRRRVFHGVFQRQALGGRPIYLMTIVDKEGEALDGSSTYRLTVPPNAPVKLYRSATAYDRATHALIRDLPWSSRASNTPR